VERVDHRSAAADCQGPDLRPFPEWVAARTHRFLARLIPRGGNCERADGWRLPEKRVWRLILARTALAPASTGGCDPEPGRSGAAAPRSVPNYPNDVDELANRVATVAALEGWCPQCARAAYAAWFIENKDPGEVESLSTILRGIKRNPSEVIARANDPEIREKYAAETEVARSMGIFGSPTFVCGAEIFWGDDRLEDAVGWGVSQ